MKETTYKTEKFTWLINEPHFMHPNEDCMGNPTPSYWRVFADYKRKYQIIKTVTGFGDTAEKAVEDVKRVIAEEEKLMPCENPEIQVHLNFDDTIHLVETFRDTFGVPPNSAQEHYLRVIMGLTPIVSRETAAVAITTALLIK